MEGLKNPMEWNDVRGDEHSVYVGGQTPVLFGISPSLGSEDPSTGAKLPIIQLSVSQIIGIYD